MDSSPNSFLELFPRYDAVGVIFHILPPAQGFSESFFFVIVESGERPQEAGRQLRPLGFGENHCLSFNFREGDHEWKSMGLDRLRNWNDQLSLSSFYLLRPVRIR